MGLNVVIAKPLHHFWKVMEVKKNSRWEEEWLECIVTFYKKKKKKDSGNYRLIDKVAG